MSRVGFYLIASLLAETFRPILATRKKISLGHTPPVASSSSNPSGPVVVKLQRVSVSAKPDTSFYLGNITVGTPPQHLQVVFDTASGHVLLPHKKCESSACLEHHRYSPFASSTALDVNEDGGAVHRGENRTFAELSFTTADLGEGVARGVLVREHVCMSNCSKGRQACVDLAMLAATQEEGLPFEAMPGDGIVGLGLEGLAVTALSSFFPRLVDSSHAMLPEFGIALGATGGEIVFGGRSPSAAISASLRWFRVFRPEDGWWQLRVLAVRVGGTVVDPCEGGCSGIVDTASSRLGAQSGRFEHLRASLQAGLAGAGACHGPDLELELQGGFTLAIPSEAYASSRCEVELGKLDLQEPAFKGVYSLGTAVLRSYYAAFDWGAARIGLAPVAKGGGSLRMAAGARAVQIVEV